MSAATVLPNKESTSLAGNSRTMYAMLSPCTALSQGDNPY
jgi:hypothetical protein